MMKRHYIKKDYTIVRNQIFRSDKVSTADMAVFFCLSFYADNETGKCFPTLSTLAKASKLSVNTVRKSIKNLEQLGFIKVEKKKIDGMRLSNVYTILDPAEGKEDEEGKKDEEGSNSTKRRYYTVQRESTVQYKQLDSNYTNKNYTNKKALSKDKGETSFASQKTLIDIQPLASKPKKKKPMTHREIGLAKIKDAKNGLISWEDVTYRDFTYYYIEKHNEKMKKKISFNRYESVSIIRDSFIKSFNIPKERVCEYIDKLLDIYSDSPMAWDCLSFNMIRNNHPLMKDLMLRVETSINAPQQDKLSEEQLEKEKEAFREWKAKLESGSLVEGVDYF